MREILDLAREVASLRSTVLIRGESGTGKELIARAIHNSGDRASQAVRRRLVRRAGGNAAGKRVVRPRKGLVHRRHVAEEGQVRDGRRRHDFPG